MAKQSVLYSPYGAFELKSQYQRNFGIGTGTVLGVFLLSLLFFWVKGLLAGDEMIEFNPNAVIIKTVADLGPPPSIAKKPPQVKVQKPDVVAPKVGIPKPVADEDVEDEDVVLATKDELAEIIAPDITAGDDVIIDIDEDYLPGANEFVPVEIQPEMIFEKTPSYPRLARQAGIEGVVWIAALVGKNGSVLKAQIAKSSGNTSLDDAALIAAKENKYKPAIQNGRPIALWVKYKVNFSLSN